MAEMMQFDLVSPERSLVSTLASAVQIPGAEGDLTAMPGHAPLITTLRPGILTVTGADGVSHYAVTGGFAEIGAGGTTVLAERAYPRGADNRAAIEGHLEEARKVAPTVATEHKDSHEKFMDDLTRLLEHMV